MNAPALPGEGRVAVLVDCDNTTPAPQGVVPLSTVCKLLCLEGASRMR